MKNRQGGWAVRRTVVGATLGLALTAGVLFVSSMRAYRNEGAHLVIETTVTLVTALLALMVYGRYRRSGALSELLLVYAMSLLSLTALFLVTLPQLLGEDLGRAATSWSALVVRLLAALLILAASLLPPERLHRVAHARREAAVVSLATIAVAVVVVVLALTSRMPDVVAVVVRPEQPGEPSVDSHPIALLIQGVNLVCYAVAAVMLTRTSARRDDAMLGWFAAACALAAWAQVNYLLFPSLYTDWLYSGDVLRLGFYLLLLVGAMREIGAYWRTHAILAVEVERRRLARDLHDGVVQELGWIRSECARGKSGGGVVAAADRALAEARRALSALTEAPDEPLAAAIGRAVSEVGDRYDVPVQLDLDASVEVPLDHREQLVRVAREAVANAVRHSGSPSVFVTLSAGRLTVGDEGRGFDPAYGRPGGFGLTSMRERAEGIRAALVVTSSPGYGTCVEVSW